MYERCLCVGEIPLLLFNKELLPGLLVDSADYHPEEELFPEGNNSFEG